MDSAQELVPWRSGASPGAPRRPQSAPRGGKKERVGFVNQHARLVFLGFALYLYGSSFCAPFLVPSCHPSP